MSVIRANTYKRVFVQPQNGQLGLQTQWIEKTCDAHAQQMKNKKQTVVMKTTAWKAAKVDKTSTKLPLIHRNRTNMQNDSPTRYLASVLP
jgi:hypothetical protein